MHDMKRAPVPHLVVERVMEQVDAALAHDLDLLDVCGLVGGAGGAEIPAPSHAGAWASQSGTPRKLPWHLKGSVRHTTYI